MNITDEIINLYFKWVKNKLYKGNSFTVKFNETKIILFPIPNKYSF